MRRKILGATLITLVGLAACTPPSAIEPQMAEGKFDNASATLTSIAEQSSGTLAPQMGDEPSATPMVGGLDNAPSATSAPQMGDEPSATPTAGGGNGENDPRITATSAGLPDTGGGASPQAVAALPMQVVSASGAVIGTGTLRLYHASRVAPGDGTTVELTLNLNTLYITPTPFGAITPVPVVTATPGLGTPTATPRSPQQEVSGLQVAQRMGASLFCSAMAFAGCDSEPDVRRARLIGTEGETWSWILSAAEAASGLQDLRVQLWTVSLVNGNEQADFAGPPLAFRIELATPSNALRVIVASIGIGAVLGLGGVLLWMRRPKRKPRSTVFISYRRRATWSVARTLNDRLKAAGADVFLDVDDINEGRFEEIIKDNIRTRDYFVLILAPTTLESEWVIREATYALENGKRIIPVLVDDAQLYEANLPPALRAISSHNAITLTPEFFEAGLERLLIFVGLKDKTPEA